MQTRYKLFINLKKVFLQINLKKTFFNQLYVMTDDSNKLPNSLNF